MNINGICEDTSIKKTSCFKKCEVHQKLLGEHILLIFLINEHNFLKKQCSLLDIIFLKLIVFFILV